MKTCIILSIVVSLATLSMGADAAEVLTPDAVFDSLVAQLTRLSTNHAELAGFQAYANQRTSRRSISFQRNLKPVTTKRAIRPADFGDQGMFLQFVLDDGRNPMQATRDTVTWFPHGGAGVSP